MSRKVSPEISEELITGYLDGALTQQEEQRVRLLLDSSAEAKRLFDDIKLMREAAMSTKIDVPEDMQWQEAAQTPASGAARGLGVALLVVWAVALGGFGLYEAWVGTESWLERALVFGGLTGFGLLLLSVAIDRLRASRTDRYKEVEK